MDAGLGGRVFYYYFKFESNKNKHHQQSLLPKKRFWAKFDDSFEVYFLNNKKKMSLFLLVLSVYEYGEQRDQFDVCSSFILNTNGHKKNCLKQ